VISEDIIIAVSVTIFLTALLVAMMFGILWIRIGKKTGRLNILTASEIEEFRRSSVSDENKSIKLQNYNEMVYDTAYEIKRDRLLIGMHLINICIYNSKLQWNGMEHVLD